MNEVLEEIANKLEEIIGDIWTIVRGARILRISMYYGNKTHNTNVSIIKDTVISVSGFYPIEEYNLANPDSIDKIIGEIYRNMIAHLNWSITNMSMDKINMEKEQKKLKVEYMKVVSKLDQNDIDQETYGL